VVVVPRDRAATVLASGQQRQANEHEKRARLGAGELGVDMYALRGVLEGLGVVYLDGPPS
jgi:4-hydroxy-4-methyl-2-oxoglutarate aldolase